jgi:hypothetical protein
MRRGIAPAGCGNSSPGNPVPILRTQHVRMPRAAARAARPGLQVRRALVAGGWMGLFLAGCQGPDEFSWSAAGNFAMGQAGNAASGAAGNIASGAAGNVASGAAGTSAGGAAGSIVSGAAGNIVSGAAGTSAGGAGGGGTGVAGTSGSAGNSGAAGGGGATGSGGAAGRGGTTGAGGAGGRGGATGAGGAAGSGGRGGTGGAAGTTGRGGRGGGGGPAGAGGRPGRGGRGGGAGGTTGTGGAGVNSCPLGGTLNCTAAGSLELTPDGQIVDFSAAQWNNTTSKWCDAHGLDGSVSSYAGTGSTAAAAVDTTARNLRLDFMVSAGQYAGGRVNFDSCVDASSFNAVQFTASVTEGSLTGCVWLVQIQTQNQRPTTLTNPMGGTCNATMTTCERYPAATLTAPTATAAPVTVPFTAFDNPSASTIAMPTQISGLQWQVNSGNSGSGTCTVELRIDNVRFVTQ